MNQRMILLATLSATICAVAISVLFRGDGQPSRVSPAKNASDLEVANNEHSVEIDFVPQDVLNLAQQVASGELSTSEFVQLAGRADAGIEQQMLELVRGLENPEAHFNPLTFAEREQVLQEEALRVDAYELAEWEYLSSFAGLIDNMELSSATEEIVRSTIVEYEARRGELFTQFNQGQVNAVEVAIAIDALEEAFQRRLSSVLSPDQVIELRNHTQRTEAEFDLQLAREYQMLESSGNVDIVAAASSNDFLTVQAYLNSGVDPNSANSRGVSVLHKAASRGNVRMIRELIAAGANINPFPTGSEVGSPLLFAATAGRAEAIQTLIEAGADLEYYRSFPADTALSRAAASGSTESVKVLLEAGADASGKAGEWALIDAIRFNDLEMEQMLLDAGANGDTLRVAEVRALQEAGQKLGYVRD